MIVSRKINKIVTFILIVMVFIIWAFPTVWLISGSFKPQQAIIEGKLFSGFKPSIENYVSVFATQNYIQYFINSLIVSVTTTVVCLVIGTLAAYSITRYGTGGRIYSNWVILMRMTPPAILIIPFYLIFRRMGLINTVWALVIANTTFNIPFVIWTMKGFFGALPEEMEEAAIIDGCSQYRTFFQIIFPLLRPILAVVALFSFRTAWNDYLTSFIISIFTPSIKTLTVAVVQMKYSINAAAEWHVMLAGASISIIPILVLYMFAHKQFINGLTAGSVKG